MARIRTVKPEFWTSEQIMELSPLARLLFIGLWNFRDDRGVHPAAYKTLKPEVFPADDVTADQIHGLVDEMIEQGLLTEFDAQGRHWWHVTGWHHQMINRPSTSKYPPPPSGNDSNSMNAHGGLSEDSVSAQPEVKLREVKGREVNIQASACVIGEADDPPSTSPASQLKPSALVKL